eukprot:TRINITY_DN3790_c0_g1_i1.p1 TRINITY_DN3790_c0_g1~~TRINITY_DN3790_c0_g1_i1.p1  ORF type:complete len:537 (-),score=172.27 TRINITY_DN3790_c0_g1_i1:220-1830(-)
MSSPIMIDAEIKEEPSDYNYIQSNGNSGVEGQLWELLCCLHSLGKDESTLLVQITGIVAPNLNVDKIVPVLVKMFEEIPLMLQQQIFRQQPHILNDPPAGYATLRLLLGFRDLQNLLSRLSILQLLHLTNNIIPPGSSTTQLEFLFKAQQIFQSWTVEDLNRLHTVLSDTPIHMERQQLLQLEPNIPWEMLHFIIELLKLPWEELSNFREWFSTLAKRHLLVLIHILNVEPAGLLSLKQRFDSIAPPQLTPELENQDYTISSQMAAEEFSSFGNEVTLNQNQGGWDESVPNANGTGNIAPAKSTLGSSSDQVTQFQLRIARQPPSRTVYQRILKPFPSVMLIGGNADTINNNLFVEASLMRSDSDVELPTCIEGNRIIRISNGVFATFKKLKILSTSQQQGTLFRLKFALKRYVGNVFEQLSPAVAVTNPIEVFSHTLYLSERPELTPAPPIIHEILPTTGIVASRTVILGVNFVNSPTLKVRLGEYEVPVSFHEQGTLVCTIPALPRTGTFPVRVSNDGTNYCETKVFFTYLSTS